MSTPDVLKKTLYAAELYRSTSREISADANAAERFIFSAEFDHLCGDRVDLRGDIWMSRYVDDVVNPHIIVHEVRARRKADGIAMLALLNVERCANGSWGVCLYTFFKEDKKNPNMRHVYEVAPVHLFEPREFNPRCSC